MEQKKPHICLFTGFKFCTTEIVFFKFPLINRIHVSIWDVLKCIDIKTVFTKTDINTRWNDNLLLHRPLGIRILIPVCSQLIEANLKYLFIYDMHPHRYNSLNILLALKYYCSDDFFKLGKQSKFPDIIPFSLVHRF